MKKDYGFAIKDPKEFDFHRIIKEVRQGDPEAVGFIVYLEKATGDDSAIVFLFNDFLSKFHKQDKVEVENEDISPIWGDKILPKIQSAEDWCFFYTDRNNDIPGRLVFMSKENIKKVLVEIKTAKEFSKKCSRELSVKVKTL